ncbi:Alpha/beta hydrolase family protein [Bradyrhizobium yuanmingense]|uniref:Alpha/beta hydrolase family protein n=1 Tax=Bradyrhizobium yuanmingense TaxID=108015 RepID=A0A1C3U963_9BRAD|nr:alpha/beta fold hydrolase [Bradyrhizobium yuanmingense]TWI30116.1 putative serine esterase DUF676 [Bradyrhizobium yuanmingense]SCB11877.1 Alpha/beta hydrolase family protein [Bradyrhizobium yuanmingense]
MPGLIVFLHGLTGNENSWGAVPEYLQSDDFDVTTPTYSASINGLSDVEISAQRILTEIRTRFPDHSPICFAGHSLGGLVAREICRHLLLQGPDDFLNKVPAVITLGTPLEGARIGNWLLRKLPFVSPKIHQIATESYAFGEYRRAIAAAKQRKVMPVVHGRTFSEIELSLRLLDGRHAKLRWIGLGGIVPLLQHRNVSREISSMGAETFISKALAIIRNCNPNAKIHAFGAGGTRTFPALYAFGADSADSIGWRQAAGFGSIFLPMKSQRTIKWNETKKAPRKLLDNDDISQLRQCGCPICRATNSVDAQLWDLRSDFYNRSIHNAWTITHQYDYWPPTRAAMRRLVANGGLGAQWAKACS